MRAGKFIVDLIPLANFQINITAVYDSMMVTVNNEILVIYFVNLSRNIKPIMRINFS